MYLLGITLIDLWIHYLATLSSMNRLPEFLFVFPSYILEGFFNGKNNIYRTNRITYKEVIELCFAPKVWFCPTTKSWLHFSLVLLLEIFSTIGNWSVSCNPSIHQARAGGLCPTLCCILLLLFPYFYIFPILALTFLSFCETYRINNLFFLFSFWCLFYRCIGI